MCNVINMSLLPSQLHLNKPKTQLSSACPLYERPSGSYREGYLKELFSCVTFTFLVFEMLHSAERAAFSFCVCLTPNKEALFPTTQSLQGLRSSTQWNKLSALQED